MKYTRGNVTDKEIDISSILPSMKVYPFPVIINLSKKAREAYLECPSCKGIDDFYSTQKTAHYSAKYCEGRQPVEVECENPIIGKHTHNVPCAGILEPHFHVLCCCCQSVFYLSLPNFRVGS